MNCILIFDNLNDVIYAKYNNKFSSHIQKLGVQQGLLSPKEKNELGDKLNTNMIIQLFSPVVTSQRVMSLQFGNSYTSVQCSDGTNIVFDEYMGFLCLCIGVDSVIMLQHKLSVFITLVRHVCGPNVTELKNNIRSRILLNRLIDTWQELHSHDQACLVEAIEQLSVNADIVAASISALENASSSLRSSQSTFDCSRSHALLFVENKLLALFTSREAEDLSPLDTMFLSILSSSYYNDINPKTDDGKKVDSTPEISPAVSPSTTEATNCGVSEPTNIINDVKNEVVLLKGKKVLVPHAVHLSHLSSGVTFLLLYQICNESLCVGFDEAFTSVAKFNKLVGSDADSEIQKKVFESLESGMKKIFDYIKKIKNKQDTEPVSKQLQVKWDQIKKKYSECAKNNEVISTSLAAGVGNLSNSLRQLYQVMCTVLDTKNLPVNHEAVSKIVQNTQKALSHFTEFLSAKAHYNYTLRSSVNGKKGTDRLQQQQQQSHHSHYWDRRALLSINKYMEEFPGLVHFLYIDRNNHRVTAPFLHFSSEETNLLAMKKIWEMVKLSRNHIRDGHLAFSWKDTTFNYAYYLWFEDTSGTPLKPKINPINIIKTLPMPGILAGDFYRSLIDACFPKMNSKVRCFELYCIHLGLATSSCVLDQSRRIAATVWEVSGNQSNPNLF